MHIQIRPFRLAVVAACAGVLLVGCGASSDEAANDVKITACKGSRDEGRPTADGTILNKSSKSSGYTIHVKFKDASGNAVGDGVAVVAKVDPDETAKWDATGTFNAKGKITCELDRVVRAAVP